MAAYDEALSKSLKDPSDFRAAERLTNVFGKEIFGDSCRLRRLAVIARNRGRKDVAEMLEKSLRPDHAEPLEKSSKTSDVAPRTETESEMMKCLSALENLANGGLVPVQQESPEEELDRLRSENKVLRNLMAARKTKKQEKAAKTSKQSRVVSGEDGKKYQLI